MDYIIMDLGFDVNILMIQTWESGKTDTSMVYYTT